MMFLLILILVNSSVRVLYLFIFFVVIVLSVSCEVFFVLNCSWVGVFSLIKFGIFMFCVVEVRIFWFSEGMFLIIVCICFLKLVFSDLLNLFSIRVLMCVVIRFFCLI